MKIKATLEIQDLQKPYEIGRGHPLVTSLKKAARQAGRASKVTGSEGATVVTFFQDLKIPAVATGYGARSCAHMTDEFVKVGDLCAGARILEHFFKIFNEQA